MNKVILMGRLTRNPEVRYSRGENALAVANFSIAVNRSRKNNGEEETDYFNCTVFGKQAEFAEKYLKQGTKVAIIGRIQNDNYTNKEGQKIYGIKIMVDELEFAESKARGMQQETSQASGDGFVSLPDSLDEELPFH